MNVVCRTEPAISHLHHPRFGIGDRRSFFLLVRLRVFRSFLVLGLGQFLQSSLYSSLSALRTTLSCALLAFTTSTGVVFDLLGQDLDLFSRDLLKVLQPSTSSKRRRAR